MNLADTIEHTLLRPDCQQKDIDGLCKEALDNNFRGVCVPPFFVPQAAAHLQGQQDVRLVTVVGFPMGYSATAAKVEEIKRALGEGADEIDVVANICALKTGNWAFVRNDIDSVTRAVHLKGKVVKIIVEAALLTDAELEKICKICADIGVDFVKTSTGYNGGGATPEMVQKMRAHLPQNIQIKASGGIRDRAAAEALLAAGAACIGSSSGPKLLE